VPGSMIRRQDHFALRLYSRYFEYLCCSWTISARELPFRRVPLEATTRSTQAWVSAPRQTEYWPSAFAPESGAERPAGQSAVERCENPIDQSTRCRPTSPIHVEADLALHFASAEPGRLRRASLHEFMIRPQPSIETASLQNNPVKPRLQSSATAPMIFARMRLALQTWHHRSEHCAGLAPPGT
jgi:hypothetical protein